jgi:hypothetical protein
MKYFIILLFIIFSSFGLTINNPNDTLSVYSWRYHKNSINGFQTVGELNNIRSSNLGKPCNVQLIDTFVINATTTIDSNMVLDVIGRGYFKKGTGDSLIINGHIGNVPNRQWLDTALPVRFAAGVAEDMRPEWFGLTRCYDTINVPDNTIPIQRCIDASPYGQKISFPAGVFPTKSIFIRKPLFIEGSGWASRAQITSTKYNTAIKDNKWKLYGGTSIVPAPGCTTALFIIEQYPVTADRVVGDMEGHLSSVSLSYMTFADDRTYDISGIQLNIAWRSSFSHLSFRGLRRAAIHLNHIARESSFDDLMTMYCGTRHMLPDSSWGVFDFDMTQATSTYNNNFNFANIETGFNLGDAWIWGSPKDSAGGGNGLRIVNWFNHGMLSGFDGREGANFVMTDAMKDSIVLMNLRGCGNVFVANSQLSISGTYNYQVKIQDPGTSDFTNKVQFVNCTFGGWYNNGDVFRKNIYADEGTLLITNCSFSNPDSGALDLRGTVDCRLGNNIMNKTAVNVGKWLASSSTVTPMFFDANGINFGNVGSADSSTFDYYREGKFVPIVYGATDSGTCTYTDQTGFYTRVGNRVMFSVYVKWSGHTGTGGIRIGGLPWKSENVTGNYVACSVVSLLLPFDYGYVPTAYINKDSPLAKVVLTTPSGVLLEYEDMSVGQLYVTGTYKP